MGPRSYRTVMFREEEGWLPIEPMYPSTSHRVEDLVVPGEGMELCRQCLRQGSQNTAE